MMRCLLQGMDQVQKKTTDRNISSEKVPVYLSKRWIVAYVGMLGFVILYSLRVNMSVAVVSMARSEGGTQVNRTGVEEFAWDKSTQSIILSSFFYAYMLLHIPGGWVADVYGGRLIIGLGILVASLATIPLSLAAIYDYRMVIGLRVIAGLAEGVVYPAMHSMWGRWAPTLEVTKLASFTYSGSKTGSIVTFVVAGFLCGGDFADGCATLFYVSGVIGVLWSVAWFYLVSNFPETHPTISNVERDYILQNSTGDSSPKIFEFPLRAMLTSRAVVVCLIAHMCNMWMQTTLMTGMPMYLTEVLKFSVKQSGVLSALPYIASLVMMLCSGQLADCVRSRWLSTTATRRLFQAISFLCSSIAIVGLGFVSPETRTVGVLLLIIAMGFDGVCHAGYMVNHMDFAPRYAGFLYGYTSTMAGITNVVAPLVMGIMTPNKTQQEWRNVFFVCSAITFFGCLVFGLFARGEVELWAKEVSAVNENVPVIHELEKPHYKSIAIEKTGELESNR